MTCQHCQTWNLDDDHRCRRCGRRIRSTPTRSAAAYPIAATATARAYEVEAENEESPLPMGPGQQTLFPSQARGPVLLPPSRDRVVPFESTRGDSTRARLSEVSRPAPLKVEKVEVSPRGRRGSNRKTGPQAEQQRLDLFGEPEVLTQPQSNIICDAPVAPNALRTQSAFMDSLVILIGCALAITVFRLAGGTIVFDKRLLPYALGALATIPVAYRLIWSYAGIDSVGMHITGLRLIDFDGNPPSRERRLQRTFGSFVSFLAAGIGLVWALVDEDGLTWHDHMSGTFPTLK